MGKEKTLNLCDKLLLIQSSFSQKFERFDTWLKDSWLFSFFTPTHALSKRFTDKYTEPLDYEELTSKTANRASKCYLVFLSPLIVIALFHFFTVLYDMYFYDNTVLFFREYIKLLTTIPLFLLFFLFITPFTFFRLWFKGEKKHMQVYTYGLLVALSLPTLVIPRVYHIVYAEPVVIKATVSLVFSSHRKKWRSIIFASEETGLAKMDFSHLSSELVDTTKVGDTFMIHGKKSRFYFTYNALERL